MLLSNLPYRDTIREKRYASFGGLNRTTGCAENEFRKMENISMREFPCIAPVRNRTNGKPSGIALQGFLMKSGNLFGLDTSGALKDIDGGVTISTGFDAAEANSPVKNIIYFNNRYIVFPDAKISKTGGAAETATTSHEASATVKDGTIYGVSASANTIEVTGSDLDWYDMFFPGDSLKIKYTNFETVSVLREKEMLSGGYQLRFDDNLFDGHKGAFNITLTREVPNLERSFVSKNRLWGFKGRTIYASALGDPTNFQRFDGISTDSWTLDVIGDESFTDAIEHGGYPVFLAPDKIVTVYGSYPSEYYTSETNGGMLGCIAKNTAVSIGGCIYYLSTAGVCRWAGGLSSVISAKVGVIKEARCAGSDGKRYYIECKLQGESVWSLLVYDTETGFWTREKGTVTVSAEDILNPGEFVNAEVPFDELCEHLGKCYGLAGGKVYEVGAAGEPTETGYMSACAETGAATRDTEKHKDIKRFRIRAKIGTGNEGDSSSVKISIDYDDENTWTESATFTGVGTLRSYEFFVHRLQYDHYHLKIEGTGEWILYAISPEYDIGDNY